MPHQRHLNRLAAAAPRCAISTSSYPDAIRTLVRTSFQEDVGEISPDGRWLAYQSDSSGRREIYVRPFPDVGGGQWLVSTSGGVEPLWARNGRELFYRGANDAVMSVPIESRSTWAAGTPRQIFEGRS